MCILYSILLLTIILILLITVHFYDKELGLMASLHVDSVNIKGSFFSKFSNKCRTIPHVRMFFFSLLSFISVIFLVLSGDIETNLGPDGGYSNSFSFWHWNLNSIAAHNFVKMSLLQAYNAIHRFDIICLCETYLDDSYHTDDDQLGFPGYKLIRADKPNNIKKGGVCICYRKFLSVKIIHKNILNVWLVRELSFGSRRVCLVSIYRTPSQSSNECNTLLCNFEQRLAYLNSVKPHMLLETGDFNVRSSSWWSDDIDTMEGTRLESITSYWLYQIINEPIHIPPSSISSIELIFTNQPDLIINSGVHPSLHQNSHHQILFAQINLRTYYPQSYKRLVWD